MTTARQAPIDRQEALAHLARHGFLAPLGATVLSGLLAQASLKMLRGRAVLFRAGDPGTAVYLVLNGWIKLSRPGNGRDLGLDIAGQGDVFGELAVLCGSARAADAVALAPSRLLVLDGRFLLAAWRANPDALLAVVRLLAARLGRATEQMGDARLPAEARLARAVLRTDPEARALRKQYEARVAGPSEAAAQKIAKARFAVYGTSIYPDATFTLRLSYGAVAGWSWHGETVPPYTHFAGLYRRATGEFPFALTPRWVAAEASLNPHTVFDLATTNDIIGGNSGSPLIDAKGDVVGAIFDGNIHSLGGAFAFDPAVNRSVAVSTAAITEALDKVYHDTSLVQELTGG